MKRIYVSVILILFSITALYAQEAARLMRFPTIHKGQVVFSYAGDLYTVNENGGVARQLTSHDGYEMFSKFSPDGKYVAFTGQYDGNTEVFVIPAQGGEPKRLTHTATLGRDEVSDRMGPNNIVMAWTPDSKYVIYRSRKASFNSFVGQLYKVPVEGGMSEQLPLAAGGFCSFSPDGTKLAFNQVFREFRTWKYYQGGMADDVWIYDFNTNEVSQITNNVAQDIQPMWYNDKIYFLSDRDRTMNLFAYDTQTKQTEKVTHFMDYDIKFPSLGDGKIIFEKGGYLFTLDLTNNDIKQINIRIAEDFIGSRSKYVDASKSIYSYEISPKGDFALFSSRGDVYIVPKEKGVTYNITKSSGAHDRNPKWSPDGKYIAYISDVSGEFEIYIQSTDLSAEPVKVTDNADTYTFSIMWSPDSKNILFNDKKNRLRSVNIDTKKITEISQSDIWEYNYFNWSPDSKWVVYSEPMKNDMNKIILYNMQDAKKYDVTRGWYNASSPVFSSDGKYLFFTSDRDFNPTYSRTEWNHAYNNMSKIYLVTLSKDTPSPFAPKLQNLSVDDSKKDDNADKKDSKADKKDSKADKKEETTPVTKIDTDGIQDRVINLPINSGYYFNLTSVGDNLYYHHYDNSGVSLKLFNLDKNKETDLKYKGGYEISADGKKMLVSQNGYAIIDLPQGEISAKDKLDLSGMKTWVNLKEEWTQIYNEAWRQMRDFFYVENMHGVDWKAINEKYGQMLPYVNNRHDLNYLIGEMIGELNVGHAYINGGDLAKPERINMGLLGAKIEKDKSGYFVIKEILKGENFRDSYRSPFTEIGVNVNEGDYIIAINGKSLVDEPDIYKLLIGQANKVVELTVNSKASEEGSRKVLVEPVKDEADLYYYTWVEKNREKVEKATDGQVGYIHIPDMGPDGLNEFSKYFYPQLDKKALIIDDRGNGGGNVSPMIIERLSREVTRATMARNRRVPENVPTKMMLGPKVLLINQYSASDGDLFPYAFKKHKLGTVIGVRSWGGVVGIRGTLPFIDGCDLRKPEFASYSSEESKYIIEGYGVDPDIEVRNDPYKEFMGEDQQLDKAIEIIMRQLKDAKKLPPIPADPDKSK